MRCRSSRPVYLTCARPPHALICRPSSRQEDGVQVPIKELPARPVGALGGKVDDMASFGVEHRN